MLLARESEKRLLAGVLDRARDGNGEALVVRGAAGVGAPVTRSTRKPKTSLLQWALEQAREGQIHLGSVSAWAIVVCV